MADISDDNEIDRDDPDAIEAMPYAKLREMLAASMGEDGDDAPAFGDAPEDEAAPIDTVSMDEGIALLDEAGKVSRKREKVTAEDRDSRDFRDSGQEKSQESQESQSLPAAEASDDKPAASDDLETLLTGIDDGRRDKIKQRIAAADDVLSVFKGREGELQRHGTTAPEAVRRLLDLNAYATANPADYLAFAATQMGNPSELLGKAAERLGMKLVPAEDDDPFEDPDVKAMRQKLAAYEAREKAPQLGPDAPAYRAQAELEAFAASSPHWQGVSHHVAALAKAHVDATKAPATLDDVKRFYDAAVIAAGLSGGADVTSPAQPAKPVPKEGQKERAASNTGSVERARAASRSLDGSGQGSGRRPALDQNAPLGSVVAEMYRKYSGG